MKLITILAFAFFIQSGCFAQTTSENLYLINFKDKGTTKSMLATPEKFLSSKAIQRREHHNILIDASDLPLNENYVQAVTKLGAHVICRSRWFNYIVVETDSKDEAAFTNLPFVAQVRVLNNVKTPLNEAYSSKDFFRNESYSPIAGSYKRSPASDLYNYGAAFNQIDMIKGEFLHNNGYSGQGMTIAQLDAGFNSVDVMPVFDSIRTNNQILGTKNFVHPNENVYSTSINSHGTMVLSTMAANIPGQMVGTAPKADFWLLRTEDADSEYVTEEYFWVSAAEFADSVGADIINSSLGYTTFEDPVYNHTYADMDGNTTYITIGADKAAQKGILVVNSAGNSGTDSWFYIGAPADGDSVFTIGAVDPAGIYVAFSSKGPTYDHRIKPTVAAQGQNSAVYAPWGLGFGSGTSFSSPIIAGMSACLWQAAPSLNNMQIIDALTSTASQSNHPDTLMGWGIPDYSAAFAVLGSVNLEPTDGTTRFTSFPNPFSDSFTAEFNKDLQGTLKVELINLEGKIVKKEILNQLSPSRRIQIDGLDFLPSGIYLFRVQTAQTNYSELVSKR